MSWAGDEQNRLLSAIIVDVPGRTIGQVAARPRAEGREPQIRRGREEEGVGYRLGVDLGTTWTAAAIWREGRATIAPLGTHQAAIPSVVCLQPSGLVLSGDGAQRRALSDPEHIAREFKRRIGDDTPLIVGGQPRTAEELTGLLLRDVVAQITDQEGERPEQLALSFPATWGAHKVERLDAAASTAGWDPDGVLRIKEPEAAATAYAMSNRVDAGQRVCVYDLGGGTFDVAILERTASGFAAVGRPDGLDHVGGLDVDAAVFSRVVGHLGSHYERLDPADDGTVLAIARLRQECTRAKEALSADLDTVIPVQLPDHQTTLRLTRSELEQLIRPALLQTVETTSRAISSAGLANDDISRVLLVGGSSRIPLVAQLVGSELGLATTVDAHPKHAIALGTAIYELPGAREERVTPPMPPPSPPDDPSSAAATGDDPPARPPDPPAAASGGDLDAPTSLAPASVPAPPGPAGAQLPPKAVPVPNPTNPPPGSRAEPPIPPAANRLAGSDGEPRRWGPPPLPPGGEPRPAPPHPADGAPSGHSGPPSHHGSSDETSVLDASMHRPDDPSATTVFDPSNRPDDPSATRVLDPSNRPDDPSATRVLDPSAAAGANRGLVRSRAGSAPTPSPDATTVSPRPELPSEPEGATRRRGLLLTMIGVMVAAGTIVYLLQPFQRFGGTDTAATTTTVDGDGDGDGDGADDTVSPADMVDPIEVPDLVGQPVDRAEVRLIALGFDVTTEADPDSDEPAGTVIGQSVPGGEVADGGSTVVLTVSGGEPALTVPDIVGLPRGEAAPIFREQGFTDVTVEEEPSQTAKAGEVIRTDPAAGTEVATDTPIVVVISSGVEIATVPDVRGLTETDATTTLEGVGFDVEVVEGDGETGIVAGQTPPPGGQRVLPFTVTIEVGASG
jgi:hypothetical protein